MNRGTTSPGHLASAGQRREVKVLGGKLVVKKVLLVLPIVVVQVVFYFIAWPVPIEPVAWKSPPNPGYTGKFAKNERLKGLELFSLGGAHGPEAIALDDKGRIYAATKEGFIVRLQPDGSKPENWADTKGRPLGIVFDKQGNLIVADAYRGLLEISPDAKIKVLTAEADGIPIRYADDLDVAADGKIYFSDASTKFGAKESHGTLESSLFDIMEHGGHGRLLVYDSSTGKTSKLLDGLDFANGIALSPDQDYVLVNETGTYRVIKYWIDGPKKGKSEILIEALPSFPDNISTGLNGRFWVAFVSPRNKLLDRFSDKPFVRKILQRMPKFARPKATVYGHIIAIDGNGKVLEDLQDTNTNYPLNTSVTETKNYLYIGSLVAPVLARLSKTKAGVK
jgi:sugar lactone lactonase YvrE